MRIALGIVMSYWLGALITYRVFNRTKYTFGKSAEYSMAGFDRILWSIFWPFFILWTVFTAVFITWPLALFVRVEILVERLLQKKEKMPDNGPYRSVKDKKE